MIYENLALRPSIRTLSVIQCLGQRKEGVGVVGQQAKREESGMKVK